MSVTQSSPSSSLETRLRGHLALARISNTPTVATNVLAGAALAAPLVPGTTLILLILSMIAFYTAGMYLNDICDYEIDRAERAERPLVTGVVSMAEAWAVTLVLFVLANGILLFIGTPAFIGGLVLTGLIVLYDTWHKKNIISPLIMGANRFMVYVIAFLAFAPSLSSTVIIPASLLLLYILGLTFVAKSEVSNESFTKFWPVAVLLLPAVYYGVAILGQSPWYLLVVLAFVGWVAYSATFIYQDSKRSIGRAISFLLAGICLLDAMVLASVAATGGILIAMVGFVLTLLFQQYIKGT